MRARSFLILGAVALAVAAAAAVFAGRQEQPRTTLASGGPLFPGLVDRLGDVAAIVLRGHGQTLTLDRIQGGWGLHERNQYPADADRVRQLVSALVQMEKLEAKTSNPDRYGRLGVEDVDAPGAEAGEVVLQTAAGAPVAQLIVGNAATAAGAEGATYVRVPGEAQAWLARGTIAVQAEPKAWVQRRLMDIPTADIRELRVVHPDKSTVTLVRKGDPGEAGGSGGFRFAEVPPAKMKLKRPDAIPSMAASLSEVTLEDLEDAGAQPFPPDKTIHVKVTRMDGAVVAFDVVDQQNAQWLRFGDDGAPASLPAAGRSLIYRVPAWRFAPLERKLSEIVE